MRRRPLSMVCLVMILLLYLGTGLVYDSHTDHQVQKEGKITVVGRVYQKEWVRQTEKERKVLYLHLVSAEDALYDADIDRTLEGQNIICYLKSGQSLPEMGSIVKVRGRLQFFEKASNPGQFDAESYYHILKISFQLNQTEIQAKSDTYSRMGEKLYNIRKYFSDVLESTLSERDASIMKTMLLGEKRAADKEIKALYQRNGIAHILAISGLHISLLGMALFKTLKKLGLPVWAGAGISSAVIVLYGFMTGFSVSSLRAVIMFVIHMAALLCGRTYDRITAAFLAALLLLFYQPLYLYSSSFLFSFGCIFAIAFLVPSLTGEKNHREKQPGPLLTSLLSGAAITMAGIPLQLCFFYQLPLYATILNLMVIPLMSFLIPGGMLLLFFYKIPLIKAATVSFLTGILAVYEQSCLLAEKLPFHVILPGKPGNVQTGIYLLALLVVILLKNQLSLRKKWALVICAALFLFFPGKRNLTLTFLDVGQGECIHIRTAEGSHYLIDGGSTSVSSVGTYRILPYLKEEGVSRIEAVFITHPDEDHYNGMTELMQEGKPQGISIGTMYLPDIGEEARTEAYRNLVMEAVRNGISVEYVGKGQFLNQKDFKLLCLHPEKGYESGKENEFSTVLLLSYGDFKALLTGDVEGEGEGKLLQSLYETGEANLTVLKAAHHGSAGSTSREMLTLLHPAYTVISCGEGNSYGHPHEELLDRLSECGTDVMITYETGAITFETDGKTMRVKTFLEN